MEGGRRRRRGRRRRQLGCGGGETTSSFPSANPPCSSVQLSSINKGGERGRHSVLEAVNIGHALIFPDHWAAAYGQEYAKIKRTTVKPLCDLRRSRHGRRASERGASAPCGVAFRGTRAIAIVLTASVVRQSETGARVRETRVRARTDGALGRTK